MMIKRLKQQRTTLIICLVLSMILHLLYGLEGMKQMEEIEMKYYWRTRQTEYMQNQIDLLESMLEKQEQDASEPLMYEPEQEKEYIGTFEITYYTAGFESTGKTPEHPAYGITKSGTTVEEGRTIAADWSVLEPGTRVYIDGIGERVVEDTGNLIVDKSIDVYVEKLEDIPSIGRHKADVWIVEVANDKET